MLIPNYVGDSVEKRYYIKRSLIKDESLIYNGSIFPTNEHQTIRLPVKQSPSKLQTLHTNMQKTITVKSGSDEIYPIERLKTQGNSNAFPRLYPNSDAKPNKISNKSACEQKNQSDYFQATKFELKQINKQLHPTDPFYSKLEKTIAKRVNANFNRYKKGWIDSSLRRKGRSVLQRSAQKVCETIDHINIDAAKRKNQITFTQTLRNNHEQRTFIFPARPRQDLSGLKGRGGEIKPSRPKKVFIQEVFKHSKSKTQEIEI